MQGRYFGALSRPGKPAGEGITAEQSCDAGIKTRRFADGYLQHRGQLNVFEDEDVLCLACGQPRFLDPREAAVAASEGVAAGWAAAFRRAGSKAPVQVHGRFAVVLIRPSERAVVAATDRFGTWSICYAETAEEFRFGERADDVAAERSEISIQALYDYLFFHVIPAPTTVFEGVYRLPPGHVLESRNGAIGCRPYWQPLFESEDVDLAGREAEFLTLVESAVARDAATDTVGAFLSGGTDSSTIAGMLCRVTGGAAKTYSIGFGADGYDEMAYARLASRHFGTEHHEYYVTPADLLEGIPRVARHYEQPFGNSSAVPAWICAERAKSDGLDLLLAGDGGDELFGGNERYARQMIFERYAKVPRLIRRGALEPLAKLPGMNRIPLARKIASYIRQAQMRLPDRLHSYNLLLRVGVELALEPSFLHAVDPEGPIAAQREWWDSIKANSTIDHMLAFDWKYTLADNDLPKVVGATNMAGLEARFPLLSDELLVFAQQLPPEWKIRDGELRWFFKYALRNFLPEEILKKEKHGFGLPFGVWAGTDSDLQRLAGDTLLSLERRRIVSKSFLNELMHEYLQAHPGYYGEMVWILMMLELWFQAHAPEWRFG